MKSSLLNTRILLALAATLLMVFSVTQSVFADEAAAKHKLIIQVSTDDAQTQTYALNNAVNIQKMVGMDNIDIEVVAYGPGLGLLTKKSKEAERVKSLALQNISFIACGNTMAKIEKKTGKKPELTEGVQVVKAGAVHIMERQEQGWAYLRP